MKRLLVDENGKKRSQIVYSVYNVTSGEPMSAYVSVRRGSWLVFRTRHSLSSVPLLTSGSQLGAPRSRKDLRCTSSL